ncbi:His-Xaa-Ser system radical SAM maturase HxsB [Rhizobium sp. S163]|uniref:His-Xaa-Ser system radical SAM maturase HxsB n=1 Tax=Rhizobium sp. S163 TaxID=3055039 RepID=UPI0025A952C4|nr:His-Xaa-Ser system radical SAM maturase HxsB [Rhizobium sp. S163]MDM9644788.1 His-Xaa-Ser system radical SAM maturase HxsB [Rhizobium sp. S163]
MDVMPLKFRPTPSGRFLFCDDAGGFFEAPQEFLERYAEGRLTGDDERFLESNGHGFGRPGDLRFQAFGYRWARRLHVPTQLDYVILVPTLRCNLACSYCQVSRVNESTPGHDWDRRTLQAVIHWLDGLHTEKIKIEFQGGEPLLRLDVLQEIREFARQRFATAEFVVCTNLQDVNEGAWEFLSSVDTFISTSLDPTVALHKRNRTGTEGLTARFLANLDKAQDLCPGRVSALPTFDPDALPDPEAVVATYASHGLQSLFLRPVNHQGFARKRFRTRDVGSAWNDYVRRFIFALIEHNAASSTPMEEFYFSHCLRRVLLSGHDGHVDLRNPNTLGTSYLVVDHDGSFYPTDEARMMGRLGQIDLRMGNVHEGFDPAIAKAMNAESLNTFDADCIHCPYQAFCGIDLIDDLSRYGRIDMPRHETDFCKRHLGIFDLVFELIYSEDEKVRKSVALWAGLERLEPELLRVHS